MAKLNEEGCDICGCQVEDYEDASFDRRIKISGNYTNRKVMDEDVQLVVCLNCVPTVDAYIKAFLSELRRKKNEGYAKFMKRISENI